MCFCGHNDVMAAGLAAFTDGLATQTKKRADEEKVSIKQVLALELEEIDALLLDLRNSAKADDLAGVISVGSLIRHLYAKSASVLQADENRNICEVMAEQTSRLNQLLFGMEEHYYDSLRPNYPRVDAVRKISCWLEKKV